MKTFEPRHEITNNVAFSYIQPIFFFHVKTSHQHDNNEPHHEISNNVVCATSKTSDQPAHTRSLIRAFAYRLNIL